MQTLLDALRNAMHLVFTLDPDVFEYAGRSLLIATVSTLIASVLGVPLGMLLAERTFRGRRAVVTVLNTALAFPTVVVGSPIVRESDGLALSSRNIYLDPAQRAAARSLSRGMFAAAAAVTAGERSARLLEEIASSAVDGEAGIDLNYATLADQDTAAQATTLDRPAFLAVAARVGSTRLLDNIHIDPQDGGWVPDLGVRLAEPSILYREV